MTTRPSPVAPDWLVPGADVIVVRGHRDETVDRTRIAKVYKRYFTVELHWCKNDRFSLDKQVYRSPGMWSSSTYVFHVDSDKAKELLNMARRRGLVSKAQAACDRWSDAHAKTCEMRLAAIAALQAVEDDE